MPRDDPGQFAVGGGRELPPLLFVTSAQGLAANIGQEETDQVLDSIRAAGLSLFDELPAGATDSAASLSLVRERLGSDDCRGVVLIGGYDVVPSQRLDCLPPALRQRLVVNNDADDFIVWSDDGYGDPDGDLIPELPVSRIPDAKSADLVFAALAAGGAGHPSDRRGVRNLKRPFAEPIFNTLPGTERLLVSEPTTPAIVPFLDAELVYLMLHGSVADATRYVGETPGGYLESVNLTNIHAPAPRVVFTGCCWAALVVEQPARRVIPGLAPAPRAPGASIALTFLRHGATAFVGCTGTHYSPTDPPFAYYGGPMHSAFWAALLAGSAPAEALFQAKRDYVVGFPHGLAQPGNQAIESKILRQYTCLGLGW